MARNGEADMRDDVMIDLIDRAMRDPEFREQARQDPEATLRAHGFDLTGEELQAVKEFQQQTAGLSDEALNEAIAGGGRRQGA
jgi:hypothetical protein